MNRYNRPVTTSDEMPTRRIAVLLGGIVLAILVLVASCQTLQRVDPGEVGVVVDFGTGTANGQPSVHAVQTGQYFLANPITQKIAHYPISQQTLTMVRREKEGKILGDDSVACQDTNGIPIHVDSSTLWRVDPVAVGNLYLLRPNVPLVSNTSGDIEDLVVRRETRNAVTQGCSEFRYDQIFGKDRATFGLRVEEILKTELTKSYIIVDKFALGEIYLSTDQQAAIQRKATAEQEALAAHFLKQKAENEMAAEVTKREAEAKMAEIQATGRAKAVLIDAEANATAIRTQQKALADSPAYLTYYHEQKWDGKYPSTLVGSGANPLLQLTPGR